MIWSVGRLVAWVKRGALALERIADAQEQQSSLAYQSFNLAHPSRRPVRAAEFGVADVEADWNKLWAEQHPSQGDE